METARKPPIIANHELLHEIGAGSLSVVWRARPEGGSGERALKLIDLSRCSSPGIANALEREAGMTATLAHDNVITIFEAGVADRHFYLSMELLEGGDLASRISAGMEMRDALSVARSIADAMGAAHAHGVVHRNLRPSNVLFGEEGRPVLTDFGIGRIVASREGSTRLQSAARRPYYLAPEQITGRGATPASDIYGLGVLLYEMLSGKRPFEGDNAEAVEKAHLAGAPAPLPEIFSEVEPLVRAMLATDPKQRPRGAAQVAEELEKLLQAAGGATVPRGSTRIQVTGDAGETVVQSKPDQATVVQAGEATELQSGQSTEIQSGAPTEVQPGSPTVAQPSGGTVAYTALQQGSGEVQRTIGVGSLVRDRFRIEAVLGEGGMGSVYCALDLLKEEAGDEEPFVALKVLHPQIATAELTFMALQREAKRAQQLAHPNIVTVYDLDRVDGVVYMTMELLKGEDSEQRIEGNPDGLEPDDAREIVRGVSAGLAYAHQRGITHADLKPQNVFLAEDGRAKLLDFGIARAHQASKPDAIEEMFSGYTPAYASPEILEGQKAMPADDVYALGCVTYYYFTGRHPFDKRPATEARDAGIRPKRPHNMRRAEWKAVSAALSFEREKRPKEASDFIKRFFPSRIKQTAIAISTVVAAAALAIGLMLGDNSGPEIPFDELPPATQTRINSNLEDAKVFLENGEVNAALQLYDSVLTLHPGDRRGVEGMSNTVSRILDTMQKNVKQGSMDGSKAASTLDTLLTYKTLPKDSRQDVQKVRANL